MTFNSLLGVKRGEISWKIAEKERTPNPLDKHNQALFFSVLLPGRRHRGINKFREAETQTNARNSITALLSRVVHMSSSEENGVGGDFQGRRGKGFTRVLAERRRDGATVLRSRGS